MQKVYTILIADRVGFIDTTGNGVEAEIKQYIKQRNGIFHYGSLSEAGELGEGIHFFYMPDLDEADIGREALAGRYDMVNLAATKVPGEACFPKGGVRWGAGTNNFPEKKWEEKGTALMNVPAGNSVRTALTWLDALIAVGVELDIREVQRCVLKEENFRTVPDINRFPTNGLEGKRIAILGITGNIGHEVCNIARALRMEVVGWSPSFRREDALDMGVEWSETIEKAALGADIVSLHIPYKAGVTGGIVSDAVLEGMKRGGILMNFARGELVDGVALRKALEVGQVGKVAVDADIVRDGDGKIVSDAPLKPYLDMKKDFGERVFVLPHIATDTDHYTRVNLVKRGIDQTLKVLEEGIVCNCVQKEVPKGYVDGGIDKPAIGKIGRSKVREVILQSKKEIADLIEKAGKVLEDDFSVDEAVAFQRSLNQLAQISSNKRVIR